MSRAQFTASRIFLYMVIMIAAAFILIFGYTLINKLGSSAGEQELMDFVVSLQKNLKLRSSGPLGAYGSVKDITFSLPYDIETVCFVDSSKGYNSLVDSQLNDQLNIYQDYNLFIKPFNKFSPKKLDYLELDENENPLCVKAIDGKIKLGLTSKAGKTQLSALAIGDRSVECSLVKGIIDPTNKIDIMFLGNNYDDKEDFSSDVHKYVNDVFLKIEPFSSNIDKLTFFYIDVFSDLGCDINGYVDCDDFLVKQLASNCPNDFIFVLYERSKILDLGLPIRSSANPATRVATINTADDNCVLMHEFGHTFAGLADEYIIGYSIGSFDVSEYANCDVTNCDKWEDITSGCYGGGQKGEKDGCSFIQYYRSIDNSIMRNLNYKLYGPVSDNEIIRRLNLYGE